MISFKTEFIKHKRFAPEPSKLYLGQQPKRREVSGANSCFCSVVATTEIKWMREGKCVATGRRKRSEVEAPSLGPLSVVLNERLREGQISATEHPCAVTSSRAFILSHSRWGTNILTRNYCRFTERGRSLSSPQQRGGSDTPLLCSVATWKQMSIRFSMLSSVAWGYCQLLISPRFGVTCVGLAGVAFEPMSCPEWWHAVPSPDLSPEVYSSHSLKSMCL